MPLTDPLREEMRAAGFEPEANYPGKTDLPWPSRCTTCGQIRRFTLSHIRQGWRCKHAARVKHADAVEEMRQAGYEPLVRYPGRTDAPWPSRCAECGQERSARLSEVRRGARCTHRYDPARAETRATDEIRAAGFEPDDPYPGKVNSQWKMRCTTCGMTRYLSLTAVRRGRRCKHYLNRGRDA